MDNLVNAMFSVGTIGLVPVIAYSFCKFVDRLIK